MKYLLLSFLISPLLFLTDGDHDIIWVDTFNDHAVEVMPQEWSGRKKKAKEFYKVKHDPSGGDNHFLAAHTINSHMFIIKKMKVDIAEYPYLNWKWRPHVFPPDGDESIKSKCDVVASVNVVLVAVRWKPKTIKYSWSTTLPEGTFTKSPFSKWPARADIVVLQSGIKRQGEWITEKVNVLEDYKRLYDKEEVDSYEIDAIVLMSDSDNTHSESAADYDDIYFSKE